MVLGEIMEKFQYMIKIKNAFKARDSFKLREIADDAIKEAVVKYDKDLARIAVLAYSLSKILSKLHFRKREEWHRFEKEMERELAIFVGEVKRGETREACERMIELIRSIDESAGNYARNLVEKAKVKMASTAYALGLSLESAANLTEANKYELMRYIGITKVHDRPYSETISPSERYSLLRRVLRVKE